MDNRNDKKYNEFEDIFDNVEDWKFEDKLNTKKKKRLRSSRGGYVYLEGMGWYYAS